MQRQPRNPFLPEEVVRDKNGDQIVFYFDEVDNWICENNYDGRFNTNFYESIKDQWNEWGRLSDRQFEALENIWQRWVNK